jgi:glycosyltransferase involved in cell wall biosynthesis
MVGRRIAGPAAGARAPGFALAAGPGGATVEVREGEVPDFRPTPARRLAVAIRWGQGNLPAEWVGAIRDRCDDVWVATQWGWGQAVASGVAPEAVHVVTAGVDTAVFSPEGERGQVRTRAATKLLAVSDCSERSGIDALLESYLSGFGPEDAVCLVVLTTDPGGALGAQVRAAATPGGGLPAVEVVDGPLPAARRAALYRACDVLVHPDRATSSQDAVLEAMACGLATIVPDGGATTDLCDGWTSWIVGCRQVPVDPADAGVLAAAGRFWQLEPDRDSLTAALEAAAGGPDARLRKGLAAHERVAARFTLDHRAAAAAGRLAELVGLGTASPARSQPAAARGSPGSGPPGHGSPGSGSPGSGPPGSGSPGRRAPGRGVQPQHRPARPGSVLWSAPFFNHSGYAEEARGFLRGLSALGWQMVARSTGSDSLSFVEKLRGSPTLATLVAATGADPTPPVTAVLHAPGAAMQRVPGAAAVVGRTMFETDGLPAGWVARLNCLDEVWVPSAFNAETFRQAGTTVPLHVVPGGVDTALYRPGRVPLELPGARGTVYLAIFEWTRRKAPDVLLRAWAEAFDPGDPACLVLRCFPKGGFDGDTTVAVDGLVDAEIARLGLERPAMAPILVLGGQLRPEDMPGLMAAADVFVGVSRGEGWGRPLLEAMACGLPAIGTRWSGNLEFMTDRNSLLVEIDGLSEIGEEMGQSYRGQRWAEPSAGHLAELLVRVGKDPARAARLGERARADVEARWSWEHAAAAADRRLLELGGGPRRRGRSRAVAPAGEDGEPTRPPGGRVRWVGDFYGDHSFATVNRELCARLVAGHGIEVDAVTGERPPYLPDNAVMVSLLGSPRTGGGAGEGEDGGGGAGGRRGGGARAPPRGGAGVPAGGRRHGVAPPPSRSATVGRRASPPRARPPSS